MLVTNDFMKHNSPINIQFDLIENGLDFVTSGVEHILKDTKPYLLKYAILHLSAGTELLLKEVLKNEHWSLIFENPTNAKFDVLKTGEFRSVDFETLLTRLTNICEIKLSQKELGILRQLRKHRNKIEHFEFNENSEAIKSLTSKVLCLLLNFINEYFEETSLSETSKDRIETLRSIVTEFKEFANLRTSQIRVQLEIAQQSHKIENCPLCRQAAFVLEDDLTCLFCGFSDLAEKVALLYVENILGENSYTCMTDGGEFPVLECVHCGADTFVNKGDDGYVCFSCFETNQSSELKSCTYCGQLYEGITDEIEMCEYCVDYLIYKD